MKWLGSSVSVMVATGALVAITAFGSGSLAGNQKRDAATVLLFLSTDCPVSTKYPSRLNRLFAQYSKAGVSFQAYFPNEMETREGIANYAREAGYAFPYELDFGAELAKRHGIRVLPVAIVFDSKGKKVYQGPVDDNRNTEMVKKTYLADVLAALSSGKELQLRTEAPFGCILMPGDPVPAGSKVNFAEHVATIVYKRCAACHRVGEVAPFSLTSYADAKKWSSNIARATQNRIMPPWKAVSNFNEFLDENRLSDAEIETLKRWDRAGAPRGDTRKEPKPPQFSSEWTLGSPDLVLTPDSAYKVDADGNDVYRNFILKTDFAETRWIKAIDVRPGNKKIVHHVIAFLDESGQGQKLEARQSDGQIGYSTFGGVGFLPSGSLGGWAPGLRARKTPEGIAFELKPGTTIVLQVHYHKSGKAETDQTKLALYFAKERVEKDIRLAWVANPFLRIPAGVKSHKVEMTFPINEDVTAYGAMPHMHLLGKSMKAWLELPDGTVKPVVWVDNWEFKWQMIYAFKEPLKVPKGSKLKVEAYYDNSADNPNNPNNPPKETRWGEQTTDEMFLLILAYTVDSGR